MEPASAPILLTTHVAALPGLRANHVKALSRMGIHCVADLILHMPHRYEHELPEQSIAEASRTVSPIHGAEANIAVQGELATVGVRRGRKTRVEATLEDPTGTLKLMWFNMPWLKQRLHPGKVVRVWGKAKRRGDYLEMTNPRWSPIDEDAPAAAAPPARKERYRPIYPASEDVSSEIIEQAINQVLDDALAHIDDHLYEEYRDKQAFPELADAYRMVHRPEDEDEPKRGRRRLAFDELLLLQLGVFMKRRHRRQTLHAPALKHNAAIDEHILARFPFELTESQREVVDEIVGDLKNSAPMNRLLQGDVGSGKTAVALYGMLMAAASGNQAAIMAPTALLAEQHFASISDTLQGADVTIELLTGSMTASQRTGLLERLESGEIDLLVGTHALLTESVQFHSLAFIVIDEQHRFGVHQRATLRAKSSDPKSAPHTLVMTATPIPRTMSLTLYGDLDISTIRGFPPGRQPIVTKLTPHSKADTVYDYIAGRLRDGEQAYIVVPVIDDSDRGLKSVRSHMDWLEKGHLREFRLASLHGRVPRDQREATMYRFRKGEIDALIATTVIEVGVDVPNASVMVIEHAEQFGLAQLHQLRGRIGRGERKSLCVLLAEPTTEDATMRLDAIAATSDGFQIAEKDLEIRGPGELFGSRQSGIAPFRVARLPDDLALLRMARRDAQQWIDENPLLAGVRDALLRKRLLKAHGEDLGLGDVA